MTDTTFTSGTTVSSAWLNDINDHVYNNTPISPATTVHPSSVIQYTPAGTGAVATIVQSDLNSQLNNFERYGAIGNGVADDTVAIQKALDSGITAVYATPGKTYLTGPLTTTKAGQKIFAYGSTLKLKPASSSSLFKASAIGVEVFGGTWDVNNVAQSGILLYSDYCSVRFATIQNCGAIGIQAGNNINYATIANNFVKDAVTYGIFLECTSADAYGNRIIDNVVDTSATTTANGIFLIGPGNESVHQYQWLIRGNKCNGAAAPAVNTSGISARAVNGILSENIVTNYDLCITADITSHSVISNNRTEAVSTSTTAYNIEVNGNHNVISGNYTKSGKYGIVASGSTNPLGNNVISNNVIELPVLIGIYIHPSGAMTAQYLSITGNNIDLTSGGGTVGVYLFGNCAHTNINGNTIKGPGSGVSSSYAVFLDTPPAAAYISIEGNKCSAFSRAFAVYSSGALTVTNLFATANDLSNDITNSTVGFFFDGSSAAGNYIKYLGNMDATGGMKDIHDQAANIFTLRSSTYNNPEGNLVAGIGSLYISLNSAQVPYIKSTGTGNTGWVAL